ncbi:hypothetical protein FHT40_006317 [Mycolicibacterium sp. BK556]|uniref:helix-turn-helix domain-containing protein n=1 Tax=unclassified Mycolicibacterium TaxID=2636767 RepID=UPI001621D2D6|nr:MULTISPECIES: helix-turn-helix domain-containing protein [unclassified Mycolicibacterium]MBB3606626.1 hypothetical protein [Mycolicibacterium sp. BK556]MBB3636127.1 hypothetical protein [Mycolicibacterium sp. BK607]
MSKQAGVLLELLSAPERTDDAKSAHLIGQVVAEVIAGGPDRADMKKIAATALLLQQDRAVGGSEEVAAGRGWVYSLIAGMFQTLMVYDKARSAASKGQGTVKERVLYVLAEGDEAATVIAQKADCAPEVASRSLRNLRDQGLVERVGQGPAHDQRFHIYRLTPAGEKFIDGRLLGDNTPLPDQPQAELVYDPTEQLACLTRLVRHVAKHDPSIAAPIAPTLEHLAGAATDPHVRADAFGELCVLGRSATDTAGADDMQRWYEGLLDLAHGSPSITARAYYERGRRRQMNEAGAGNAQEALRDFARAREAAQGIEGDERSHRLAWCSYQEAVIALHERRAVDAQIRGLEAKGLFETITDEQFEAGAAELACDIVVARALWMDGKAGVARKKLESVLEVARANNYKRQIADARRWLGIIAADDGAPDAIVNLSVAEAFYQQTANSHLAAVTRAAMSSSEYLSSDMSVAQAEVLKTKLMTVLHELSDSAPAATSQLRCWEKARLWRSIAVVTVQQDGGAEEADAAYRVALECSAKSHDVQGQSDILVEWWGQRRPHQQVTPVDLRAFTKTTATVVADDVINEAIARLTTDCPPGAFGGAVERRDLVRHAFFAGPDVPHLYRQLAFDCVPGGAADSDDRANTAVRLQPGR